MKCNEKGCNNLASGLYLVKTKPRVIEIVGEDDFTTTRSKTLRLSFCSDCGFNAMNKRSYNVYIDNGMEHQSYPMAYSSVKLVRTFTESEFFRPSAMASELTCYCGHVLSIHEGACKACIHCNHFYDGACSSDD